MCVHTRLSLTPSRMAVVQLLAGPQLLRVRDGGGGKLGVRGRGHALTAPLL